MLANGAKLEFKKKSESGNTYTKLLGLKEIPEMGIDMEKVENSHLESEVKFYEMGIGDAGDMVYKFMYDNTGVDSPYRILRKAQEDGEVLSFRETLKDGTTSSFDGYASVKRTGGGVNGVIDFDLTIAISSNIVIVDPTV